MKYLTKINKTTERQEVIKTCANLASMEVQAHVDRAKRDYIKAETKR